LDRVVDARRVFHDRIVRPKSFPYFHPEHHFAGSLQKHEQDLERLLLKADSHPVLPQFARANVQFKRCETNASKWRVGPAGMAFFWTEPQK
jgi:hypothetical protein